MRFVSEERRKATETFIKAEIALIPMETDQSEVEIINSNNNELVAEPANPNLPSKKRRFQDLEDQIPTRKKTKSEFDLYLEMEYNACKKQIN